MVEVSALRPLRPGRKALITEKPFHIGTTWSLRTSTGLDNPTPPRARLPGREDHEHQESSTV